MCNFLATGNLLNRAGSKVFVEELAMVMSDFISAISVPEYYYCKIGHCNFNKKPFDFF